MARELAPIEISGMPDLVRIVDEVRDTQQPRLLRRDGEDVALVTPVGRVSIRRRRVSVRPHGKLFSAGDSLWNIVGIAHSDRETFDEPTDVSENKYRYLAEAYLPRQE